MHDANIESFLSHARWALRRAWRTNRSLLIGLGISTLVRGIAPAGVALAARGLINALVKAVHSGEQDAGILLPWLTFALLFTLILAFCDALSKYLTHLLHDETNHRVTSEILDHASTLDLSAFEDPQLEDLIERAQQNIAAHFSQFVTDLLNAAAGVIQALALLTILIVIDPLVIVALSLAGIPYFLFRWRYAKSNYWKEYSRTTKLRWTRYFINRLTRTPHVLEVKLFDLGPVLFARFEEIIQQFRKQDRFLYAKRFKGSSVFVFLSSVMFYGVFFRVAIRALSGAATVGDVAIFGGATANLRKTLENIINYTTGALEQALHVSNVRQFLNLKPQIQASGGIVPAKSSGQIQFQEVSFTYPGSSSVALSNISLQIRAGEVIALVGENGAGKSTLVKLIARLYDPDRGSILMDQIDLRALSLPYLRGQLSYVLQRFGRYEGTAAENIAYGNWQKLLDNPDEIEKSARRVHLHETIQQMPEGYNTILGRTFGTYDPSDGQWQQIALARAFSRNASVFILDEPASNLDAKAEFQIFSRVRELAKGRTTIFISHRFSTVSMADRIIVMEKGRIVESGSHPQLLALSGSYAKLYELHKQVQV